MLRVVASAPRCFPWLLLLARIAGTAAPFDGHDDHAQDWSQFGYDVASSGASNAPTGINTTNIASLKRRQIPLDGTVDASAIYLHAVTVKGSQHDVFFVTTTYGKTIAVDAASGATLWEYTPPKFSTWAGTSQVTNSTPVADADRQHIYAAAPDGTIQSLRSLTVTFCGPPQSLCCRAARKSPRR